MFSEIDENISVCPNCNSDLDLLNNIKLVSKNNRTNKLILVLIFIALIISILFSFHISNKNKFNKNENNNVVFEQLKKKNDSLKIEIAYIKKLNTDTLKMTENKNPIKNEAIDEYVVQKNDNLWLIAQKIYGDGFKYKDIAIENKIEKPYEIMIGSKLLIKKDK